MKLLSLSILSFLVLSISVSARRWDNANAPRRLLGRSYESRFDFLPITGAVVDRPWSGHYWPDKDGGIAYRWRTGQNTSKYRLHSAERLLSLSEEEIALLSPAEKYDIFMGRLDYPTVLAEKKRTSLSSPKWFGLCHAFAVAAIHFKEPAPVRYKVGLPSSGDSVVVSFTTSDIKALLAIGIDQSKEFTNNQIKIMGKRCENDGSSACWDINPGSFHLALTNSIGLKNESFVMDFGSKEDVWNHPVISFSSTYDFINERKPSGKSQVYREVGITTVVRRAVNIKPTSDLYGSKIRVKTYRYTIELNRNGKIIGGEWISNEKPDFIWKMDKFNFPKYFNDVYDLVEEK